MEEIKAFGWVAVYIISGFLLLSLILGVSKFLRPHKPYLEKGRPYESGEEVSGDARLAFRNQYYVIALIFVLFEVELVLIFPWATVFGDATLINETGGLWSWFGILDMLLFMGILVVGLAYVWKKGFLNWLEPPTKKEEIESPIPKDLYEKINEKYA